jgi:hypothetical protein
MPVFEIGKPFPGNLPAGGMVTFMEVAPEADCGVDMMFAISLHGVHPVEIEALIEKPIRMGIVRFDPIIFFVLVAESNIAFDSPFGIGLYSEDKANELLAAADQPRAWSPATRRIVDLVVVEAESKIIRRMRRTTLTRTWWITLADELAGCPRSLLREQYEMAMKSAYARWTSPRDMIPHCKIIEETAI